MGNQQAVKTSGINETGVECLVLACLGGLLFIPAFFIAPIFFNIFAYAFCALAIVLGIIALVEMGKTKNRDGLVVTIIGLSAAVIIPVVLIIVRAVMIF